MNTILPIFLLIFLGYLSRWAKILKEGDERILSAYVYYFALPALFFADLSRTVFNAEVLRFILAGAAPLILIIIVFYLVKLIFRLRSETFYLLSVSTVFGSNAFFGIPYIIFAFQTESAEKLAVLSAAFMALVGVLTSLFFLELYRLGREEKKDHISGALIVAQRLLINPLLISLALGIIFSALGWELPSILLRPLQMLGRTTATVAIFMLGVFLYGKRYVNLGQAFGLSLLRILLLPALAFVLVKCLALPSLESSIIVLMHSMPLAISMMVLSERYDFHKETIASLILISSLGAAIYLNFWLKASALYL